MMDWVQVLMPIITTLMGAVIGWMTGKRKRDNELIQEQVDTIRELLQVNKEITLEYVSLQEQIRKLMNENRILEEQIKRKEAELEELRKKNEALQRRLKELQQELKDAQHQQGK